jgi:hypothetical protein
MIDTLINVLPNVATAELIACYVPQIYSNARYGKSEINIWFFVLLIMALLTFTVYNVLLFIKFGVFMGIITEGANSLLAIIVLIQVILINKKGRK